MSLFFEILAVIIAFLADILLGNLGCTPLLILVVILHVSECVSLKSGVILALISGLLLDLVYCRGAAWSPVLFSAALFSGRFSMIRREEINASVGTMIFPGAVMGGVIAFCESIAGVDPRGISNWLDVICRFVSGILSGGVMVPVIFIVMDSCRAALGLPVCYQRRRSSSGAGVGSKRYRVRRVRAINIIKPGK